MGAEHGVDPLERARRDELGGASRWQLLGVLEEEADLACNLVASLEEAAGDREQRGRMPVMAQACITPGRRDANSRPVSSWMGSASMSARSASVRPGLPPCRRATTLVGVGWESSSPPKDSSVSRTNRDVSCS